MFIFCAKITKCSQKVASTAKGHCEALADIVIDTLALACCAVIFDATRNPGAWVVCRPFLSLLCKRNQLSHVFHMSQTFAATYCHCPVASNVCDIWNTCDSWLRLHNEERNGRQTTHAPGFLVASYITAQQSRVTASITITANASRWPFAGGCLSPPKYWKYCHCLLNDKKDACYATKEFLDADY